MKTPVEVLLDTLEWTPLPGYHTFPDTGEDLPFATHKGIVKIGSAELVVYQLNTGQRVIDEASLIEFFGVKGVAYKAAITQFRLDGGK